MNVTLVHNARVPPLNYGGTERVVNWLAQGLHECGHRVTLIAAPGSRSAFADVVELKDFARWPSEVPASTDILHLRTTPNFTPPKPFVVTIDGLGKVGETFHPNTIFVSRRHAEIHGSTKFVHNGIDPAPYSASHVKENRAFFLAKASWNVKNLRGAIDVARRARMPLEVLGSRDWMRWLPEWRGVKHRGLVDDEQKIAALARARALIFPVRWEEPFGLAVVEALASGCFVVGTPYGALPEIVTPDVGVLSANAEELAAALRSNHFKPNRCRARVLSGGFTHTHMAQAYVRHYERVLGQGSLGEVSPTLQPQFQGGALLPWT